MQIECIRDGQAGINLRMKRTALSTAVAFLCAAVAAAQDLPSGTLLPIQLGTTIKAGKTKPGEHVSAKLAQYVVLNGTRIARGSQVTGRVIESQAASPRSPARIVLAFDSIRVGGRVIPVGTSLRAMASMRAVFDA